MNTQKPHTLFLSETPAPLWQDKTGVPRVSAASVQPSTAGRTALHTTQQATNPQGIRKHSTKRRTVFAGGWIDRDTDAYIEHRRAVQKLTRSKVIATMLRERAQDDVFQRSQEILVPIIQQAIRSEFRAFANRFLALIARITYEVSQILSLLVSFLRLYLGDDQTTLHRLETQSETYARVNITRRTPHVEEVIGRLKHALGGEEGQ